MVGPAVSPNQIIKNDKIFFSSVLNLKIIGDCICALINDSAMILHNNYTKKDLDYFEYSDYRDLIPTYPGFTYNAYYTESKVGKIFIVSTRHILKGEEIFYAYGK